MTTAVATDSFNQAAFEEFQAARDEPTWFAARREAAWAEFQQLGWPSNKDEEWMRTDIRLFKLSAFQPPLSSVSPELDTATALLAEGVDLGGQLRSVDGQTTVSQLADEWASQGVLFGGLDQMLAEHGERLRPYLEQGLVDPHYDRFAALNAAFATGGTLLFVPKGVCLTQPLHALASITAGGADLSKTLVVLEDGAEATLLTETASIDPAAPGLHCGSIEVFVGKDAKLRYVTLQNWGSGVWHFAHQRAQVGKAGQLQWTVGALGSRLAKVNQEVVLAGQDAEAQVNGAMFTQGRQHLCYVTRQHHRAEYCRSDLLYKNALQDRSRTVWRGMIEVDKPAQRTDAYQRNDNLLLTNTSRADSIPGLQIEADDVRCTHGSTSGRVDEQQIFYAMCRGYTRQEAVRMIVAGFFQQVFDRISIESVREALAEAISLRVQDLPDQ